MVEVITIALSKRQLDDSLARLESSVNKYLDIQARIAVVPDPQLDLKFRKLFNGYYRVRRNKEWQDAYFSLMRDLRVKPVSFKICLTRLRELTKRVEASFASKLLATLDPQLPVIDSLVLKKLSLRLPAANDSKRIEKICDVYDTIAASFANFGATQVGQEALKAFRDAYPGKQITDTKIIDLILWQADRH